MEPIKYSNNINQAANNLAGIINQKSKVLEICILIVPYEMQVSLLASKKYKEIGITFEDEFLNFETQKIFISQFRKSSKSEIHYLGKIFLSQRLVHIMFIIVMIKLILITLIELDIKYLPKKFLKENYV